jgi:hypothetical protein
MIDRSIEGNYQQIDADDFEQIDRILDMAETAMLAVASEHHLRATKFQRWRWDQPEILMSWTPFRLFPTVGKNIRVFVKPERTDTFTCLFESNAWFDDRQSHESFVRYWDHFPVKTVHHIGPGSVGESDGRLIREYVEKAYESVSDSREIRLDHAISISPGGETDEYDQPVIISEGMIRASSNGTA